MSETLELGGPPPGRSRRGQVAVLAAAMHGGLIVIGLGAAYTLQPLMTPRHWAAYVLVALVMLIGAAVSRGKCGPFASGRLLTALGAGLVLKLAAEPQLGNLPGLGERLPSWLAGASPSIATAGLLVAAISGFWLLRTLSDDEGPGPEPPFVWALNRTAVLVLALSLVTFFALRQFYELNTAYLALLVGNVVQYYLLLRLLLSASGRRGVGAGPQVYLALAILAAFARNVLGGMMGGGGP